MNKDIKLYHGTTSKDLEWIYDGENFHFINVEDKVVTVNDRIEAYKNMLVQKSEREKIISDKIKKLIPQVIRIYFNNIGLMDRNIFNISSDNDLLDKEYLKNSIKTYLENYSRCDSLDSNNPILTDIPSMMEDIFINKIKVSIIELEQADELDIINTFIIPLQKEVKQSALDYIDTWIG